MESVNNPVNLNPSPSGFYDGKTLPGFTQDNIKELRKESQREGMDGISPRYIQDRSPTPWSAIAARVVSTPSW